MRFWTNHLLGANNHVGVGIMWPVVARMEPHEDTTMESRAIVYRVCKVICSGETSEKRRSVCSRSLNETSGIRSILAGACFGPPGVVRRPTPLFFVLIVCHPAKGLHTSNFVGTCAVRAIGTIGDWCSAHELSFL